MERELGFLHECLQVISRVCPSSSIGWYRLPTLVSTAIDLTATQVSVAEIEAALRSFKGSEPSLLTQLPSAPVEPLVVLGEPDRPQPRLDRLSDHKVFE